MIEAYKKYWKNYANFNGRSSRSDYWYVFLCNIIINFVFSIACIFLGDFGFTLSSIFQIAIIIPGLAICIRRLHDINKSGSFIFVALIPFVGFIILLVFLCMPSVNENNKYVDN